MFIRDVGSRNGTDFFQSRVRIPNNGSRADPDPAFVVLGARGAVTRLCSYIIRYRRYSFSSFSYFQVLPYLFHQDVKKRWVSLLEVITGVGKDAGVGTKIFLLQMVESRNKIFFK
jgi:hypothetical protein